MHGLSQQERLQHILRILETRDSVPVSELSETFSVSEVTVRSDLTALARQGLVARVRGDQPHFVEARSIERGEDGVAPVLAAHQIACVDVAHPGEDLPEEPLLVVHVDPERGFIDFARR